MVYRNRKTGAEFETDCICSGGDWEAVTPPVAVQTKASAQRRRKNERICDSQRSGDALEAADQR